MENKPKPATGKYTDFHSHLLPGFDDGAADMAEALKMAGILAGYGFAGVCCTPHQIRGCFDPDRRGVKTAIGKLQDLLDAGGIGLRLYEGREYYLDEFFPDFMSRPVHSMGGCILVEIPNHCTQEMVKDSLYRLSCKGHIPLIAHPERCSLLNPTGKTGGNLMGWLMNRRAQAVSSAEKSEILNPGSYAQSLMDYLKDIGCLFQGNIGSFAGIYGDGVRRRAGQLLENGIYDCLGSDAHCSRNLSGILDRGLREIERIADRDGLTGLLRGSLVETDAEMQKSVNGDLGY